MTKTSANNFSARFHILCDHAGFIKDRGRATEVTRFFDVGQTTVRNWLVESICPRDRTLQKIIARLDRYDRLPDNVSPKALQVWLEKGDSYIPNPFNDSMRGVKTNEHELLRLYKMFALVSKVVDEMSIDIYSFPDDVLNELFSELCNENLDNINRNRANKIIRDRFKSLLIKST